MSIHTPTDIPIARPRSMRAITQYRYGTSDVLRAAHVPRPVAGDGQVLVRVRAAGLDRGTEHLLTGRRATTHWASLNHLAELDPTVITDVRSRFVDDGDLITSAGVSAGIDMALHLVARLAGPDRAREVRRDLQYDPMPPV